MTFRFPPEQARKISQVGKDSSPFVNRRQTQVCTSAGNTTTGNPTTGADAGKIWVIEPENNQPIQAYNDIAFPFMVGHWVEIGEPWGGGDTEVTANLTRQNVERGGATFAATAAQGVIPPPEATLPRHNFTAITAPTVNDDSTLNYSVNSLWTDTLTDLIYICRDATATAAKWEELVGRTQTQTLTNKTLTAPTIADFTNMQHDHLDTDDGGTLSAAAIASGTLPPARRDTAFLTTSTGTLNNLDFSNASVILMDNATAATITGLAAGTPGQHITIRSIGAGNVLLSHNSGSSSAGNKLRNMLTTADTPLAAGKGSATYVYDDEDDFWDLVNHDQGSPITYTVSWTSTGTTPSIGDGTLIGRYVVRGLNIWAQVKLIFGTTTSGGTGVWLFSTPIANAGDNVPDSALAQDSGTNYPSMVFFSGTSNFQTITLSTGANHSATAPFTWGNLDFLIFANEYQAG